MNCVTVLDSGVMFLIMFASRHTRYMNVQWLAAQGSLEKQIEIDSFTRIGGKKSNCLDKDHSSTKHPQLIGYEEPSNSYILKKITIVFAIACYHNDQTLNNHIDQLDLTIQRSRLRVSLHQCLDLINLGFKTPLNGSYFKTQYWTQA